MPEIVATIGSANANSFIELDAAQNYFNSRLNSADWFNAGLDLQAIALVEAAGLLTSLNWLGSRVDIIQVLAWPRLNAKKVDAVGAVYGYGYHVEGYSQVYLSTEIPQQVTAAQCELALALLKGWEERESYGDELNSFSADGAQFTFDSSRQLREEGRLPPKVMRLLSPLIAGARLRRA